MALRTFFGWSFCAQMLVVIYLLVPLPCVASPDLKIPPLTNTLIAPRQLFVAVIGPGSKSPISTIGFDYFRGAYLATVENEAFFKKKQIACVFLDDSSDSATSASFAEALCNSPFCLAIIGSVDSGCTIKIDETVRKSQRPLPVLSPISSATSIGVSNEWIYRVNLTDRQMLEQLVRYLVGRNLVRGRPLRVSCVHIDNYFGENAANDLSNACCNLTLGSIEFLEGVHFSNTPNYNSLLSKLDSFAPDAIGLFCPELPAGEFARAIRKRWPKISIFATSALSTPAFLSNAGMDASEGVIVVTSYSSVSSSAARGLEWRDRFRKNYEAEPDNFAAQGYDGMTVLVDALRRSTNLQSGANLESSRRELLSQLSHTDTEGVLGPLSFGTNRVVRMEPSILIWNEGELVPPGKYALKNKQRNWLQSASGHTVLIFLFLLGIFGILPLFKIAPVTRWGSALAFVMAGVGTNISPLAEKLDFPVNGPLLIGMCSVTFIALAGAGLVSQRLVVQLHTMEPFATLTKLALRHPQFRRRVLQMYISQLITELEDARRAENGELYTPIPVRITGEVSLTEIPGATFLVPTVGEERFCGRADVVAGDSNDPVTFISNALSQTDLQRKRAFAIEAPGGQGKSALLRAIVEEMARRHSTDPRVPVPVMLGAPLIPNAKPEDSFVSLELPTEFIEILLDSGALLLVIDGAPEMGVTPEWIRRFLRNDLTRNCSLVATFRTDDKLRLACFAAKCWAHCAPLRLTDLTLRAFIKTYDAARLISSSTGTISENLREACRGEDGKYLQILVRLALLVPASNVSTVTDLYREALRHLLSKGNLPERIEGLLKESADICLKTYWLNGQRILFYADAPAEMKETLGRLITAGVVTPIYGSVQAIGAEPLYVKFFHDSIQTFLTARGLLTCDDPKALQRAAGNEMFLERVPGKSGIYRAELFDMCVALNRRNLAFARQLLTGLVEWAEEFDGELAKNRILEVLSVSTRSAIDSQFRNDLGAGATLRAAAAFIVQGTVDAQYNMPPGLSEDNLWEVMRELGNLYKVVAPVAWAQAKT
jgi:ABC-type branched-subunit amino acid transport system substrate-binding protein